MKIASFRRFGTSENAHYLCRLSLNLDDLLQTEEHYTRALYVTWYVSRKENCSEKD